MAGRRTFFSFHYQRDIWRACQVRNAGVVDAQAAAGWSDASLWEEAKRRGDDAIRRLIRQGLNGTSVTAVLIGAQTYSRRWVQFEIDESIRRGNGLLGVRIHMLQDRFGHLDFPGRAPARLIEAGAPIVNWNRLEFGAWIERSAVRAGLNCVRHGTRNCIWCG